jgi:hypothetical protein
MRSNLDSIDDAVRQCVGFGLTEPKHLQRVRELYKFAQLLYEQNTPSPKTSIEIGTYLASRRAEAYETAMIYVRGEVDRIQKTKGTNK